jgi:hypothetical protein
MPPHPGTDRCLVGPGVLIHVRRCHVTAHPDRDCSAKGGAQELSPIRQQRCRGRRQLAALVPKGSLDPDSGPTRNGPDRRSSGSHCDALGDTAGGTHRRLAAQDLLMQQADVLGGLQPQLIDEGAAQPPVDLQ